MILKNIITDIMKNSWKYATFALIAIVAVSAIIFIRTQHIYNIQYKTIYPQSNSVSNTSINSSKNIEDDKLKSLQEIEKNLKEIRNAQKQAEVDKIEKNISDLTSNATKAFENVQKRERERKREREQIDKERREREQINQSNSNGFYDN